MDKEERKRELTKLRVRKYRERLKRGLDPIPSVTSHIKADVMPVSKTDVTPQRKPHWMNVGGRWMWI